LQNEYSLFFVTIDFINNWSPVIEDNVACKFNIKLKTWGARYHMNICLSGGNRVIYFRYCSSSLSRTNTTTIIIPRLEDKRTVFYACAYYIFFLLCHESDRLYLGYLGTKYRYRTLKGNHLLLLCMNIGIQACLLAWKWKSSISLLGFFSPLLSLHQTMRNS